VAFQLLVRACLPREVSVLRKSFSILLFSILTIAALPQDAAAQRAVHRPGGHAVYVSARPYYPVYRSSFYWGLGWGWYGGWYPPAWYGWYGPGWWGYPYGWYGPYPGYGYPYDYSGAARIEVKPREAEVYVDGHLVGRVDDFDGWLQRLHVAPGEHELQIYLPGHRTLRENVLFRPGATLKISGALEPLPPGTPDELRPTPKPSTERPRRGADEYGPDAGPRYPPPGPPRDRGRESAPDQTSAENFGSVAIRVQPANAEIVIDGDRWESPASGQRLVVQLAEGPHRIEIRLGGYRTYSGTIRVRRGETTPLNVSLTREEGQHAVLH
jgi:PEGA domain-containing protein